RLADPPNPGDGEPMPKTVIVSSARTPIGKLGGGLSSLDATELGGTAIKAALERAEVAPEQVQHVVMGQVLQAGQGQIPSRQAQIKAGIPKEVSSETINKVCASSLRAVTSVDQAVRAGDLDIAVAGGMESMSRAPYLLPQARFGYRMGGATPASRRSPSSSRSRATTRTPRATRPASTTARALSCSPRRSGRARTAGGRGPGSWRTRRSPTTSHISRRRRRWPPRRR